MKMSWLALAGVILLSFTAKASNSTIDSFDSREATIDGVHNALFSGITTCRDVVSSFLSRVETFNPSINSIISLNPNALSPYPIHLSIDPSKFASDIAEEMDARIAAGNVTGSLFCIPILLKDNYDTLELPTTGGCLDLADNKPTVDAAAVFALKNAGAIILGKTNLHEFALEGLTVSSLGGQTINPYDFTRTPGGSSGGTGAAIASSFSVFGTGTLPMINKISSLANTP
jgi:Asp-tRNA(Asn)/Glu-tRNA(Gln) amidotransferase A subunit family amidase